MVCHHKRQHFELLVAEIKCRYSTADLCAQVYANMIHSNIDSFRFEEIVLAIFVSHLDWLSADYINNGQKMKKTSFIAKSVLRSAVCSLQSAVCGLQSAVCVFTRVAINQRTLFIKQSTFSIESLHVNEFVWKTWVCTQK